MPLTPWIQGICRFAAKLPSRVTIDQSGNYINVEPSSGTNPNGTWNIIGIDSTGRRVNLNDVPPDRVKPYHGAESGYDKSQRELRDLSRAREEERKKKEQEQRERAKRMSAEDAFLAQQGVSRRKLDSEWHLSGVPALDMDAMDERAMSQAQRVLKQQKGVDFSPEEIAQIARLSVLNDSDVTIDKEGIDPARGLVTIHSPITESDFEVSPRVLKAFSLVAEKPLPEQVEQEATRRVLRPYGKENPSELSRDFLRTSTPALASYIAQDPNRVSLEGQIYENYGVQRFRSPLGRRCFQRDMSMFGLDPDSADYLFPDEVMKPNTTRGTEADDPTRGSWTGEVTIKPDESGRVPRKVMDEVMRLAPRSNPFISGGGRWNKVPPEEFDEAYKRGPVKIYSTDLFRHVVGLGKMGNEWKGRGAPQAAAPAAAQAPVAAPAASRRGPMNVLGRAWLGKFKPLA
jgi:hypothetical protein